MAKEKAWAVWQSISDNGGFPDPLASKGQAPSKGIQGEAAMVSGGATVPSKSARGGAAVLAADTVVVVDDQVLGNPRDEEDARRMLQLLSGREHQVITGVCLRGKDFEDVRSETTAVYFADISEADVRDYVATGEPMDKAGAYAIQGIASRWISKIEGDYFNVVGLPVDLVWRTLRQHGAL
jgi:MAF protein